MTIKVIYISFNLPISCKEASCFTEQDYHPFESALNSSTLTEPTFKLLKPLVNSRYLNVVIRSELRWTFVRGKSSDNRLWNQGEIGGV